jgi:cobalt-zinc-cadmium resistance protein CzcA
MFRPMAMTVVFALLTSLVLALTLMPVLAAIYLRTVGEKEPFLIRWVKRVYRPALQLATARPLTTLAITLIVFVVSIGLALGARWGLGVFGPGLGAEFIPRLDEGAIGMQAFRLPSVSLEGSVQLTGQIEKCLLKFPEVETVVCKTGRPEIANDPMPVYLTDIYVGLKPAAEWRFQDKDKMIQAMRQALMSEVPSNAFIFSQPIELRVNELVAGVKSDVGVSLYGDDLQMLAQKGEEIARVLEKVAGAEDVEVERTKGLPFLRVTIKRQQIARHGINVRDVLDAVASVGGKEVGQVFEGQRRFPLQVRFGPGWRADLEKIKQIRIADPKNRQIPLEELAYLKLEDGPAEISREAIRRRILVTCNVRGRDIAGFVHDARQKLERRVSLPSGYTIKWGGQFKNLEDASERLTIAVPVALFLIFAILHLTFNSLRLASLIFLNVPLAATGGILALWLRGLPFSISAGVGFIALFGVAVLNGVVLVTYIVELRRNGLAPVPAAFEGAMIRVRPVLMTALVASLGFIPMAISTSAGAEVQRPLATVVIGGLVTSSLLTLFVLPAIYRWFDPAGLKAAE